MDNEISCTERILADPNISSPNLMVIQLMVIQALKNQLSIMKHINSTIPKTAFFDTQIRGSEGWTDFSPKKPTLDGRE